MQVMIRILLLIVLRQHRTKTALRLSTTSACSFSVILHKTRLITVRLQSDEKIDGASAALSLCGIALKNVLPENLSDEEKTEL